MSQAQCFLFIYFHILITITYSFTDVFRALGLNDGLRLPGAAGKGNGARDKRRGLKTCHGRVSSLRCVFRSPEDGEGEGDETYLLGFAVL